MGLDYGKSSVETVGCDRSELESWISSGQDTKARYAKTASAQWEWIVARR
jgi:hypothetical protein